MPKSHFSMVLNMRGMLIKEIRLMDLGFLNCQIGRIMKDSGSKIKLMVMENSSIRGDKCMRENGKMTGLMVKDSWCLRMEPNMKENSMKEESMA